MCEGVCTLQLILWVYININSVWLCPSSMAARKTHKSFLLTPCNDIEPTKDATKPVSIPMLTLLPILHYELIFLKIFHWISNTIMISSPTTKPFFTTKSQQLLSNKVSYLSTICNSSCIFDYYIWNLSLV
jgi:hypothetical protein